ncbi:hypothetical protein F5884DRAFT_671046 [Xylogone sp. PMI_703]|nr:hypothetical protein F5884DRAFT_671046 [Xylogone sp. PMI_703]
MGESTYSASSGRTQLQPPDWTPYSTVSSFNLPAHYDSSLITPVTMASSPSMTHRPTPTSSHPHLKELASPHITSPNYHYYNNDDDFASTRVDPPMKLKNPSSTLHISTLDQAFPSSPYACTSPYWGAFGVSATSNNGTSASTSSPNMNQGSNINSSGGISSDGSRAYDSMPNSANSYRCHQHAPILIAPNPATLRPAKRAKKEELPIRPPAPKSAPPSGGPQQTTFPEKLSPLPAKRKRKSSAPDNVDGELAYSSGEVKREEQILLQLAEEGLPWKEIAVRFYETTGKNMKVPALQMRLKRLRERLRKWTEIEEQALTLSVEDYENAKWDVVATDMLKYGCVEKWPKEAVQKKWYEMHPEEYNPHEERSPRSFKHRLSGEPDHSSLPDTRDNSSQGHHDTEAQGLLTECRSRAASDASSQCTIPHQQIRYEQRHHPIKLEQHVW